MFYIHPKFEHVKLQLIPPIYGGTKYLRVTVRWWTKTGTDMGIEEMTIEKNAWMKFVTECEILN